MIESRGEKIFRVINYTVLGIFALLTLYPFIYVLSASISMPHNVVAGKVLLFPKDITFAAYTEVLTDPSIWMAYGNTIFYTVVGTAFSMLLTICGAYPLSKRRLHGRKFFTILVTVTMWFDAGMIPFYLNLKDMGMLNSRTTIIVAFAISVFNVILLRTFFEGIPAELEEAAKVDGATELQVLCKVYLPLSKASLATIGLFYAISRWNGYFWAMILLKDESKMPLQVLIKKLIMDNSFSSEYSTALDYTTKLSPETLTYATIIISIIPIIMVYPYIQKYFVKGVMVGAIKG